METILQQADIFMAQLQSRRRHPITQGTLTAYQSRLKSHILPVLGNNLLADIDNGRLKMFVASLSDKGLSASTITGIVKLVQDVISSAVDSNGNELYPRKWNSDFIDAPVVNPMTQDAPILSHKALQKAITGAIGTDKGLYALLAGSGARIGEIEALMVGQDDSQNSFWHPEQNLLIIRSTTVNGHIQPHPKTEAGNREIDLSTKLNNFLLQTLKPQPGQLFRSRSGSTMRRATAYSHLQDIGIKDGFHSFRRFRITHLEKENVPRSLIQFWAGHSSNKNITDRYIKIGTDLIARKQWAEKAGLGFEI